MARQTENPFPSWGDAGTSPPSGTDLKGGDNPKAGHYDYLWNELNTQFGNIITDFNNIDSDGDGVVDKANAGANPFTLDGNIDVPVGSAIRDGSGTDRLNINNTSTVLRKDTGGAVVSGEENVTKLFTAGSDGNVRVADLNSTGPFDLSPLAQNLRLATDNAIEDGGGTTRIELDSGFTDIRGENGTTLLELSEGTRNASRALNGTPWAVRDMQGDFIAVQYTTASSAPGTLELTNAGMRVGGSGAPTSGSGLVSQWDGSQGRIYAYDATNGNYEETSIRGNDVLLDGRGGLIDASVSSANLRLATGQSIEDGSGNWRFRIASTNTEVRDSSGNTVFDTADGGGRLRRKADGGVIRDDGGAFNAVKYITSSSAPGTLELTNAKLNTNGNGIRALGSITDFGSGGRIRWADEGGGSKPRIYTNGQGEVVANDDAGNTTILT